MIDHIAAVSSSSFPVFLFVDIVGLLKDSCLVMLCHAETVNRCMFIVELDPTTAYIWTVCDREITVQGTCRNCTTGMRN